MMGLPPQMKEALDHRFNWKLTNVPELENPILAVFDYSPSDRQLPVSIAFDYSGGPKCWLSESSVREIDNNGPKNHPDYREFVLEGRQFHPYSIQAFPGVIFEDIDQFVRACRRLYHHVEGS